MNANKKRILLVDDDENICATVGFILEARGYEVDIAGTGNEALKKTEQKIYNLAILDIRLPDMEGTELLKKMHNVSPEMIKIMLTGYPQLNNAIKSLNDGADAYFTKPADPEKLLKKIEEKLDNQETSEKRTEDEFGLLLQNRSEKLKQQRR
jgi:DNA-binding NtrC family response regulator